MKEKKILITGISGSLGTKLVEKLYGQCALIRGLSRNEDKQLQLRHKFPNLDLRNGDVGDYPACRMATRGINIVFHCAAYKFLDRGEKQPSEVVKSNVIGSKNIIEACIENKVDICVGISTDKVCSPYNIYGMSKSMMEYLFKEADANSDSKFITIRYGNVLGTTGSVVPFWMQLGKEGKELTVTSYKMTRFYWTLGQSVDFVFESIKEAKGGEVFVKKMKSLLIKDLAEVVAEHYNVSHKQIGIRPGEKRHEELISGDELRYAEHLEDRYIIRPDAEQSWQYYISHTSDIADRFSKEEIKEMLDKEGWL